MSGLLTKIGVNVETYKTTPRADAESIFRPFTDDEKTELQHKVKQFYDVFLERVAEGRHMKKNEVDAVGQGRVWVGQQAIERQARRQDRRPARGARRGAHARGSAERRAHRRVPGHRAQLARDRARPEPSRTRSRSTACPCSSATRRARSRRWRSTRTTSRWRASSGSRSTRTPARSEDHFGVTPNRFSISRRARRGRRVSRVERAGASCR